MEIFCNFPSSKLWPPLGVANDAPSANVARTRQGTNQMRRPGQETYPAKFECLGERPCKVPDSTSLRADRTKYPGDDHLNVSPVTDDPKTWETSSLCRLHLDMNILPRSRQLALACKRDEDKCQVQNNNGETGGHFHPITNSYVFTSSHSEW
ncbi:hypothetical protein BDN71DRAFT_1448079 [Pleurotus eryngii]|uniref:Uncharacterized protein n=1 Tax=Pleurotus eryngii TaxID=5323 RepID=A0A9P5ZW37_PLEER|nr:hypothetical protein BDN71DRAFT_1448079 [Pleurotus eryngii]